MLNFEDYLCEQNETLCNLAYELLCAMAENEFLIWNMEMIAPIVDTAEAVLEKHGIHPCYPFYDDDEQPCYLGNECQKPNCPMKRSDANENTAL